MPRIVRFEALQIKRFKPPRKEAPPMSDSSIGVAVIGAGMAGRAHAAGYRSASTVYGEGLPEIRLAAIADVNPAFAADTARRFGYERAEGGWEAVAAADDVDVVSVVVANPLHRRDRRGPAGRRQARALREADGPDRRGRRGHGGRRQGVGPRDRHRLRVPPLPRHRRHPRAARLRRHGPAPALQRPLLVRLRGRPAGPDELALQGRTGLGRPVRHRQPPDRPGRVRVRPHPVGPGSGAVHLRHRARAPRWARPSATPPPRSATSPSRWRTRTW